MLNAPVPDLSTPESREWRVTGMDCAACASRIRTALSRLPGVSDIDLGVMSERLSLSLDPATTRPEEVEQTVRSLGYGIGHREPPAGAAPSGACSCAGCEETEDGEEAPRPWYRGAKGRLVLLSGALLFLAWGIWLAFGPEAGRWGFRIACLTGLFPIARSAFAALRRGQPFTIEALMTIAATGALLIGAEREAALVVFLFAVGELLEGVAAERARAGIRALGDLVPKTARVETGDTTREVPVAALIPGQIVRVRPGERVPADGEIIEGTSGLDESPVTGESLPVIRGPGDPVFAGAINAEAALRVRVTKPASDNTIARIVRMVEEAEANRAPTERFIDRFSRYYMPAVVGIALLAALLPPLAFGADASVWTYRALTLLLIGCPCALVISVPAAVASALSAGARRGLLLKGGWVIETAAEIRHVAFDKTGTLTEGRPRVTDVLPLGEMSEAKALALAAAVEGESGHPLARAIRERAGALGLPLPPAREARAHPGRGASAEIDGIRFHVAAPEAAMEEGSLDAPGLASARALEAEGKTVVTLCRPGVPLALIALSDAPRPEAREAVQALREMGVSPLMLTGDNPRAASAVAQALGIDFRAGMRPEDKLSAIRDLARNNATEKGKGVMMIGDGINDAPALKQATIGIAMGSGTDVALETADGAILQDRVTGVPALIRLSRATMANIRQNIALALGLKSVFLVTSLLGITGLWIAVMADTGATVLVTLNALRLLHFDPERVSRRG